MKSNLLQFWSGKKTLDRKNYSISITDSAPINSKPFPTSHTCFYQLIVGDVDRFPGKTLDEKTAAFVETMTNAVANYSSVMNLYGGRRTRKRVSNKNKNKKTKKVVKKHRKTVKRTKQLKRVGKNT